MTAMLTDDGTMLTTSDTGGKSEARRKIFEPNKGGMEQPPWQRTQMHQRLASEFLMKKDALKRQAS